MNTLTTTRDVPDVASPVPIHGTDGDDTLEGGPGRDLIDGGAGDDYLHDEAGANQLLGGAGNDTIIGCGTITGGPGNDAIVAAGDVSGNVYQYAQGDGFDTISTTGTGHDILQFGQGVTPSSVMLVRDGDHLSFYMGPGQQVSMQDWFKGPGFELAQVSFADGTYWSAADISAMDVTVLGTAGDDVLYGYPGNNLIHGGPGNDYVLDARGNNILYGGPGDDTLMGSGVLDGGPGDDTLLAVGDAGHNVYFFDSGDGRDTLHAHGDDNPGRAQGAVAFGESLDPSHLWFRRQDDDLAINVVGSCDGLTIKDWYQNVNNQVQRFMSGNEKTLSRDKVDGLVQAMSGFAAPVCGASRLNEAARQTLAPVLAASWT
jgi:hypothetical protein